MCSSWHSPSGSEGGRAPRTAFRPRGLSACVLVLAAAVLVTVSAGCTLLGGKPKTDPAGASAAASSAPAPAAAYPGKDAAKDAAKSPSASGPDKDGRDADGVVVGRIAFDHKFHLGRGVGCSDCHEDAESKDTAGMPTVEFCTDCHEEIDAEKPPEKTVEAFLRGPKKEPLWSRVTAQPDDIVFSHGKHAKAGVECASCHRGIEESTAVSKALFTDMDACTACHTEKRAPNTCGVCHEGREDGWRPESHDRHWTALHGQVVRRGAPQGRLEDCATCHTQHDCTVCHTQEAPRDHTQHWRVGAGHGLAAALDRERCQSCHTEDTCVECHTTLRPRSHTAAWGGSRNRHCIGCHEGGGIGSPGVGGASEGCGVCHRGTPSHASAPPLPAQPPHRPDQQCAQCHNGRKLKHADNGTNCLVCHR